MENQIIEEDLKEESEIEYYRILNLEGAWLTAAQGSFTYSTTQKRKFKSKNKDGQDVIREYTPDINKLYSATMPWSLETLRAFDEYPNEIFDMDDEKATKLFINFKFNKDMIDDCDNDTPVVKTEKKKLRKLIYTSNVEIDGVAYRYFKRGASKARTANVIFVKKDCYDTLFNPCLLGLKIEDDKEYDITGLSAYISLIMSGIIETVEIKPEEILIMNDIMSPEFKAIQSLTTYNNEGKIEQFVDEYDISNNCTDGQVLLDESVFLENKLLHTSTCALLRNDLFKGNAVRTRLQDYWQENNINQVWDMYRGWISTDKIRLVITPSACKYIKFADQFDSEKDCFLNWLEKIPSTYGVVKTDDHVGRYGYSNRLSYQMLNSMNIDKNTLKDDIMKNELNYYKLIKDNTLVTSSDLKKMSKKDKANNRAIRNDMSYFIDHISNPNDDTCTKDMIVDLFDINNDFRFTKQFKDWKKDQLRDYVDNLRLGKIRISNSIYAIMVSCPYEMLLATTKKDNKIETSIMTGWEMYCPNFLIDEELLVIRNPQINAGNIGYFKNQYHPEYKWFGYRNKDGEPIYKFVTFINTWDVDTMNRLQGCDFDIDTCFLTNHGSLTKYAKDSQKWATPTNGIHGQTGYKHYNLETLANLDGYLGGSTQLIGKIVNKSAVFNAYLYHGINNGCNPDYIDSCYKASSTLSSFSQIAIDMAKKSFGNLSLITQMNLLNKTTYINNDKKKEQILSYDYDYKNPEEVTKSAYIKDYINVVKNKDYVPQYKLVTDDDLVLIKELINRYDNITDKTDEEYLQLLVELTKKIKVYRYKMIVPYFFEFVAKDNSYRIPTKMDCAMDYLEDILDNLDSKAIQTDTVKIKNLIGLQKDLEGKAFNRNKIDKVRIIIDRCQSVLDKNYYDKNDNDKEEEDKARLRKWAKKTAIKELKKLELNEKTVHRVLLRAFDLDKDYKNTTLYKEDKNGNQITYFDWDYEEEFVATVRELKEMSMLVLTLLHKSYPDTFKKCFIKKESDIPKVKRFWK